MRSLAIFRWVDLATGLTLGRPFRISTRRLRSGPTTSANCTSVAKTLPVSWATLRERWTVIWFSASIVKHLSNVIFFRGGCPDIPFITPRRSEGKVIPLGGQHGAPVALGATSSGGGPAGLVC